MSETLPRPIEPGDIKVGDKVRATQDGLAIEGPVTAVSEMYILVSDLFNGRTNEYVWTLLDRPKPDRPVGSHWRDPETGAEFVLDDDGDYLRYRMGSDRLGPNVLDIPEYTARLVPVDTFDPAALWPECKSGPTCRTRYDVELHVCDRSPHTTGLHACHHGDSGTFAWGRP